MTVAVEKLIRMAEQIAENNSFTPDADVVAAKVADHIQKFWDPRMKARILEYAGSEGAELSEVVRLAVERVRVHTRANAAG